MDFTNRQLGSYPQVLYINTIQQAQQLTIIDGRCTATNFRLSSAKINYILRI